MCPSPLIQSLDVGNDGSTFGDATIVSASITQRDPSVNALDTVEEFSDLHDDTHKQV